MAVNVDLRRNLAQAVGERDTMKRREMLEHVSEPLSQFAVPLQVLLIVDVVAHGFFLADGVLPLTGLAVAAFDREWRELGRDDVEVVDIASQLLGFRD